MPGSFDLDPYGRHLVMVAEGQPTTFSRPALEVVDGPPARATTGNRRQWAMMKAARQKSVPHWASAGDTSPVGGGATHPERRPWEAAPWRACVREGGVAWDDERAPPGRHRGWRVGPPAAEPQGSGEKKEGHKGPLLIVQHVPAG